MPTATLSPIEMAAVWVPSAHVLCVAAIVPVTGVAAPFTWSVNTTFPEAAAVRRAFNPASVPAYGTGDEASAAERVRFGSPPARVKPEEARQSTSEKAAEAP